MIKLPNNSLALLALPLAFLSPLNAETTTDPVGVVKITIAGTGGGSDKLTAISATLTNSTAYQGTATNVGTFSTDSQPLETGVATWSATEWTTEPHLCYIENAAGAEEAYLITANGTDGILTLATTFDFSSRYTSTPNYRIVKAQTLGALFGTSSVPFLTANSQADADNVYAWNGSAWYPYHHNGTAWQSPATAFGGDANDTVIFPDEGLLILRRAEPSITLTFNGSVPTKTQITTIPGNALTFVSSRYPVTTTLNELGMHNLTNWTTANSSADADRVYIWNSTTNAWDTYWHNGSSWQSPATAFGGDANNDVVNADSAMFIKRIQEADAAGAANSHNLPYTP